MDSIILILQIKRTKVRKARQFPDDNMNNSYKHQPSTSHVQGPEPRVPVS